MFSPPLPKSITPWKFGSVPIKKGANIEAMGMYLLLLDEHRLYAYQDTEKLLSFHIEAC